MDFLILAKTFEKMESTSKRLELTDLLAQLFSNTDVDLMDKVIYLIQGKLRPDFENVEVGIADKLIIRILSNLSGLSIQKIQDAYAKYGDLGLVASTILVDKPQTTLLSNDITVDLVYDTFFKIANLQGSGSQDLKMKYVSSLLHDSSNVEIRFIIKILLNTLRLGIAENTIMDALSIAQFGNKDRRVDIEIAYNVSSDLGRVAQHITKFKEKGFKTFKIKLFSPIRSMLADRIKSEQDASAKFPSGFAAEFKIDGERAQIHIKNDTVKIFSRNLKDITSFYPDICDAVKKAFFNEDVILEAEVVAISQNGDFLPFQELMHRRRKYDIEEMVSKYPICVNFFDILYYKNSGCLDWEYKERRELLKEVIPQNDMLRLVPMKVLNSSEQINDFLETSLNSRCEGLMLKSLDGPYRAGSRGNLWLKLKREYQNDLGDSVDLIIIGAFFGKGRRTGMYGTFLLGTYNSDDSICSVCKVGTGFTDEKLDQLYHELSSHVTLQRDPRIDCAMEPDVWFDPWLVIEIVASEITISPIHKAAFGLVREGNGLALRFPKFTGKIRTEKNIEDASSDEEIMALYKLQIRTKS
ncbi:MAG: ATP-dependent DNA ligase [Candidatus Nitrosoabyssus spongiisocia]|nr:MAG: ATP-dependent DNA ligase [Nitrosopumilaceae archaeon AB1(1)]